MSYYTTLKLIVLLTSISIIIVILLDSNKNKVNEQYQATETTTIQNETTTTVANNMEQKAAINSSVKDIGTANKDLERCDDREYLPDVCKNYSGCCASGKYNGNGAFCKHTHTMSCNDMYDNCFNMLTSGLEYILGERTIKSICRKSLYDCCDNYNDLDRSSSYRPKEKTERVLEGTKLHSSLGPKGQLINKCKKLCDTHKNCRGYIVDSRFGCHFFEELNLLDFSDVTLGSKRDYKLIGPKTIGLEGVGFNNILVKQ